MSEHSTESADLVTWTMPRKDARDLLDWLRHNRPLGMPDRTFDGLIDALTSLPDDERDRQEAAGRLAAIDNVRRWVVPNGYAGGPSGDKTTAVMVRLDDLRRVISPEAGGR